MTTPEYDPQAIATIKHWLGAGSINFFGMPFSGKDSQAERIQSLLGGTVLGGGAILRNSVIPAEIQAIMDTGELIPTEDYVRIVLPYLSSETLADKPLMLSSVGRWHGEEESVMNALSEAQHELKAVIHLVLSEEVVHERLASQENLTSRGHRIDDTPEVIKHRIVEFREKTTPVIAFYKEKGLLIEVDATLSQERVTAEIVSRLAQKAAQSNV